MARPERRVRNSGCGVVNIDVGWVSLTVNLTYITIQFTR